MPGQDTDPDAGVVLRTPQGRWVLAATVLGSAIVMLDSTVVNVALPRLGENLGADFAGLQWVISAYTLTLASLILIGGSLGDRLGRRRVFVIGTIGFAAASAVCALSPTIEVLVIARAAQGVAGALLTPGSLAIIEASFRPDDRGAAIGAWSGLGGVAAAVGPFLGGWLVQAASWRWVFLINLPVAVLVVWVARRHVPESWGAEVSGRLDYAGAVTGAVGLGLTTFGLIEGRTWVGVAGLLALVGFVAVEARAREPMLPLSLFRIRRFSVANGVTLVVYGALGVVFFLLGLVLQVAAGYPPVLAGAAMLPVTAIMLAFSSRAGALAQRIGPRLPMTLGPVLIAAGLLLMTRITATSSYLGSVLPAAVVLGAGLTLTVAPLTATVLASVGPERAGIASGVNNAVARAAGLLAVASIPLVTGMDPMRMASPAALVDGFHRTMLLSALLCLAGAAISAVGLREREVVAPEPAQPCFNCPVGAPPAVVYATTGSSSGNAQAS